MYSYTWSEKTGGLVLNTTPLKFSKEPRPVYYKELDILGFDKYWNYAKDDSRPYMWAEANNYIYRGRLVARTRGGSMYTAPELILIEDPEPDGAPLRFVDIDSMIKDNYEIMDALVSETKKNIYNVYSDYKTKVNIFHVSFSGGKDSEVTLDLVQKTLPHNDFIVLFGDTGMEFPDTYVAVEHTKEFCKTKKIVFMIAKSKCSPIDNWNLFGPPSTTIRWCCSVHKTAPQLLKLRDYTKMANFKEMAFVGIRGDESLKRSDYDEISYGTKHKGQYSFNPILAWNSAEVYLYIFGNGLYINYAYKKGNSRAGCLVCPMSGDKSDYIRRQCYKEDVDKYIDIILKMNGKGFETADETYHFIDKGGWKLRNNGRDIISIGQKYYEKDMHNKVEITVLNPSTDWKIWTKTVGKLIQLDKKYIIEKGDALIRFSMKNVADKFIYTIDNPFDSISILLLKSFKEALRKSAYCIRCRECEADCQYGYLKMKVGFEISDKCISCGNCHKPDTGCLLYKSLVLPKGNGKMDNKSYDCYGDHAPKIEWITDFFKKKDDFFENNTLGSMMISMFKRFLKDAGLTENSHLTFLGDKLSRIGVNSDVTWAIMLINLSYTNEINWYIKNIDSTHSYSRDEIIVKLKDFGVKDRGARSITAAYKRLLALPFGDRIGLGETYLDGKDLYYSRFSWQNPIPEVILYSLYKFGSACGDYTQFTVTRLMDFTVDSDGVSPAQIFGLDRDTMETMVRGLSVKYPDFISSSFSLGLDNVNLIKDVNREETYKEILDLI